MADYRYQPYYCEENIWHLCRHRAEEVGDEVERYAMLISNASKTCALWSQRASPQLGEPVVWDYHVVMLEYDDETPHVWDLDTRLDVPVEAATWIDHTFPIRERTPDRLTPRIRLLEASVYLEAFSSDRSHMRDEAGEWRQAPPDWELIYESNRGMNLPAWLDMQRESPGTVLDLETFIRRHT